LRCPNCGESHDERAKFCPNCGAAVKPAGAQQDPGSLALVAKRPVLPFVLSLVGTAGLIAVAFSMSFFDDAPGDIGSPVAMLFHSVGAVQFALGLGLLTCSILLLVRRFDSELWGSVILAIGLVSIASLLLVVVEGTFAVIFLAIPGLLAVTAGLSARRSFSKGSRTPA
jgi:hypothetical protein